MTRLIETLLEESFDLIEHLVHSTVRQLSFPQAENMIKVAIGMRRSGKSYFLYQTIRELLAAGVLAQAILIINFEDDRLLPMTAKEMGELIDSFYTLYPENHHRRCYFFLDEVQNIVGWELVVRRYFESKNIQLYITGSSAKLLSKEIATSLRGRSLSIEVLPYSFNEYLVAHHIKKLQGPFGKRQFDVLRQHLLAYFATGGFPAIQLMVKNEWRDTLQGYIDTVILRDIIERYKVTNVVLLKHLTLCLLKNAATIFSSNKFFNNIKSQGYKVSKETIYTYISYLEDAFLIFTVPFYSESEREKNNKPKKVYVIDSGLIQMSSLGINALYGKFFENLVYLDLRRQGKTIYYYTTQDGFEVDFVTIDKKGTRELIQVTCEMDDPTTQQREQRALEQAKRELGLEGRVVTFRDYLKGVNNTRPA
jgi:predicted AAA+ superfamily ATPase